MFPRSSASGSSALPRNATYWMPSPDEIDEEGFGFFRDTWLIKDVPVAEARDILNAERRMAEVVDLLAQDEDDFDRLAGVAESSGVDDPQEDLTDRERQALSEVVFDIPELGGLELGVSGLAHALATVRVLPAASCRSHTARAWSDAPVVLMAITEFRARALEPLARQAGCTFDIDVNRPELLVVRGRSIEKTMDLAEAILDNRDDFVQHRPTRRSAPPVVQDTLF